MSKRIRPEELAVVIAAELSNYSQEVTDQLKQDIQDVAKECVKDIKASAPRKSGKYRRGWKMKVVFENIEDIRIKIYNSAKPQLAHLLEFGHDIKKRGRKVGYVDGITHIYSAEQKAAKALEKKAKVAVKR